VGAGRPEKYDPGTGRHALWLNVGGAAGFSSCWSVDVNEGVMGDDFGGRKWDVTVSNAVAAITAKRGEAERRCEEKWTAKAKADDGAVLATLDRLAATGEPYSLTRLRQAAGLGKDAFGRAVERLKADGLVERAEAKVRVGNGAGRGVESLRRTRRPGCPRTSGT
jgi:hypothetical protein